ncbi:ATP-binding cassette domain-containing protein [Streptomyces sp. NPDC058527]|uniref:ABC transporter ATP-binding protein n=1 Tax=Streptomyces sp. NPDC058527 TaxID=3346539 RepID=UPI00364ADF73
MGAAGGRGGPPLVAPPRCAGPGGGLGCPTASNGSGKTTLLRAFLGSRRLTDGALLLRGEPADLTRPRHRRLVASLVEPVPVARDMTLREQVTLVAASWYGNTAATGERAEETLASLGLTPLAERFPSQLSSGQLQLFHLALTLVRPAGIVLLDEPERHLDTDRVALVAGLLAERAAQGTALLVATHDATLVEACDGVMELG